MDDFFLVLDSLLSVGFVEEYLGSYGDVPHGDLVRTYIFRYFDGVPSIDLEGVGGWEGGVGQDVQGFGHSCGFLGGGDVGLGRAFPLGEVGRVIGDHGLDAGGGGGTRGREGWAVGDDGWAVGGGCLGV